MTGALLREFGALRLTLLGLTGAAALFATAPGTPLSLHGWQLVTTLVLPAAAPLLLFGLLLELLMSAIRWNDADGARRPRWRRILLVEALVALLLAAAWTPFFAAVLGGAP